MAKREVAACPGCGWLIPMYPGNRRFYRHLKYDRSYGHLRIYLCPYSLKRKESSCLKD